MTKTEKALLVKGIRLTEMRIKIYEYLKWKTYAVTLKIMQKDFIIKSEKNKTGNKTTFYRVIKFFEEKRMAHQIDDGTAIAKFAFTYALSLYGMRQDVLSSRTDARNFLAIGTQGR